MIFVVIAAALVKIAFFADPTSSASPEFPTGEITEPQIPVTIATIRNDVTVQGSVAADAAVPTKAPVIGEVAKILVSLGQGVQADSSVMTIKTETPGKVAEDGSVGANIVKTTTVLAGSAGLISALPVIVGQSLAIGDTIAQVAPTSFNVTGSLAPEQQYRLLTMPTDAQVTITGGPAPFTCTGLTITSALAGADAASADPNTGQVTGSGATVRCAVPAEITVFSGLSAQITLAGGVAENVLTVPVTAVEGSAGTGNVYRMLDDGTTETAAVTLGINDGTNVEVKEGLADGDMVMQFVPGAPQVGIDMGDGCTQFPDGSMTCGG
ncbi:MAG: hypothetical protein H7146_01505 [Burkholderiaceae bacterium]|nr:hypothetical protein [Microbacteriaceae bacterium]